MNFKFENRRKFHRINLDRHLVISFSDGTIVSCRLKNISLGGMFITGKTLPKPEENCSVKFFHNEKLGEISIMASATVVWVNEQRSGLKFTSMNNESYMSLLGILINEAKQPAIVLYEFPKCCPFEIKN